MSEPYLFIVLYVEQFEERLIRVQRMKKSIEKLRKRKVLPPTKAMQDNPKNYAVSIPRRKREFNE